MAANPTTPLNRQAEEPTSAENLVTRLSERLAATANAKNVYGEPIHAHNRTVIPVAKVGYGVGAGSGGRTGRDPGSGGGGGGGVGARPVGYIEITDERTRYVGFSTAKKIVAAVAFGFTVGFLVGSARR